MEIFDKALEFYKTSERLSEPEAILKAREVERLSEAGFKVLSIKSEDVSEWDTDSFVETGYPEWAEITECNIDFEVNGKQGQVSALWNDEVNYYGDLDDKLTFVDVQSYDGDSVIRYADTIQYLLKNDPAILSSLTKAITDHKGMHEDRITAVTPSEIADIYQVTVTNGREDIILDVQAGLDQRGETEVWRVRDPGDHPVFVAEQYRVAAEYNNRHARLEKAPLLSLSRDDLKVAITPLHQAAHPEVAEWRKEEERCATEGRPYYGYGNVGAPVDEISFDSPTDDEVREVAEALQGNEAVIARLLIEDDNENDPVPYQDEATTDHKFAHPNYSGTESPDYEFFEVFKVAGQKDSYCMDVPLPSSARELFEDEPESHVPSDRNQNYFRLEITIGEDGHPSLARDGSEGDGLDAYLFDVYNTSIRDGARKYATAHGLIADENPADMGEVDGDNENDPVPYHDDRPAMTADWGEIPERATSQDSTGLEFDWEGGRQVVLLAVPDDVLDEFSPNNLKAVGLEFDRSGNYELSVKIEDGEARLDHQFSEYSLQGEFEQALFRHHRSNLQALVDKEAAIARRELVGSISVKADSDFPDADAQHRHLNASIDGQEVNVVATFNEDGRVTNVEVDPDQEGFDPAMDGGARYKELSSLLDTVKESVVLQVQEYHDNIDDRILQDTGWYDSRTLQAGYCVIPESEIDSIGIDVEFEGSYLTSGDFRTTEGYPIRLDFDVNANIEHAVIPGTKVSLKPVLEGSRDHFVEAKAQLADHGVLLSKADSGDYRVDYHKTSPSYREGERGSARYADTVSAAFDVGRNMASERDHQEPSSADNDEDRDRHRAAVAA